MKRLWWAMQYVWLTIKHKWFVARAGFGLGVPIWRLLIHDLSKFGFVEIFAYGRQFFGDKGDPDGFAIAWLHHQNLNPHHWEYWVSRSGHNRGNRGSKSYHQCAALPMPETYVREMIADWMGASRAYTGGWEIDEWLSANLWRMDLHLDTFDLVQFIMPNDHAILLEKPMRYMTEEKEELR